MSERFSESEVDYILKWCGLRQRDIARQYTVARVQYEKIAGMGADYPRIAAEMGPSLKLFESELAALQNQAADAAQHVRFLLGIEPSCSCQDRVHRRQVKP